MISFFTYNKKQLEEFINSEKFLEFPFKPISLHRAKSQIKNPRVLESDTLLILAFEGEKLAGYIGILPDDIFYKNTKIHFGWLSTIFVHQDFRGKKIAQQLLSKACDEFEGRIMITEFTPEAENMYVKSNFFVPQNSLKGKAFHYLLNLSKILPPKNKKWESVVPFLNFIDVSANFALKTLNKLSNFEGQKMFITNDLDEEAKIFIEKHKKPNSFNRNVAEIDWIVKNPWILKGRKDEKYLFSDFEKQFEYFFIKTYENNLLMNVMMLSVRNSVAKLLFSVGETNSETSNALYQFIKKNNVPSLISFDEEVNDFLEDKSSIFKKERFRKFFMHKNLRKVLDDDFLLDVSAMDADAIFT